VSEPAPATAAGVRELVRRYAEKDGRRVALIRCFDYGAHSQVDCDVYPVSSAIDEPRRAGPYIFRTAGEAMRFVDEAELALRYLGCTIS
jgi:hypothetical protein